MITMTTDTISAGHLQRSKSATIPTKIHGPMEYLQALVSYLPTYHPESEDQR